ncbi:PucR family transcriptional regulator [Amycolatopsis anabasis]|uniref:PucR family transcriptional regulator n=1 Tax=Amycolatopsis anabasis TaxID=1840409 RepID=UPI00131B4C13|nr:PucR family transcriptional regulator [Amycolatopsis anabasis]
MALTLRGLASERSLGLRVRAGEAELDRPIGWVHATELADPTAFLEGGELLLTIGLNPAEPAGYVRRLAAAGVAGIGFGTGLVHDEIPPGLVEAAGAAGLPLLEVPKRTPFIAISRTVSRAVAADEYASLVRTGRGQQELTRTAVGKRGAGAVVRKLARLVDASVLLLDAGGTPLEAVPASARSLAAGLGAELTRLRSRVASAGSRIDGHEVVIQALDTRPRSFLVVAARRSLDPADQHIVNTAASLLSLALERNREQEGALRRVRTGLLELLAAGQAELAVRAITTLWGGLPLEPWPVVALAGSASARQAAADALEDVFFAESGGLVVVIAPDDGWAEAFTARVGGVHAGVSEPVGRAGFADGLRQAEQAARAAQAARVPVLRFAEHAGRGLLDLLDPDTARAFADALLAPLRRHDETGRGDLVVSLRCWLEHHGHWDLAASRLGVHRHTLRNRMRKVEELTGRSLDSPGLRSELWLALQVDPGPR